MIANCAFLAAMLMVLLLFWVMGRLEFLTPYKHAIFPGDLWVIVWSATILFLNVFAWLYAATRRVFLKDTGRKLAHVDRQLQTPDAVVRDLSERLAKED